MDESEFEMTTLDRESGSAPLQHRRFPGPRRVAVAAILIMVTLALLLRVWLPFKSFESSAVGSASLTPAPTFTAVPLGPTVTPILLPSPLPVAGLLGAPPQDCPTAPPLDTLHLSALGGFSGPAQMKGRAPVWAVEGYFPERVTYLTPASSSPYRPSLQIIWEIGPDQFPTVTVRAFDLETGETAWWGPWSGQGSDNPQVPLLVMNPADDFPTVHNYWDPYLIRLFITHAGCYELQVSWAGGAWRMIFAAGETGTTPA